MLYLMQLQLDAVRNRTLYGSEKEKGFPNRIKLNDVENIFLDPMN
jgi:hypothetical protein